jgi:hypothetical protein
VPGTRLNMRQNAAVGTVVALVLVAVAGVLLLRTGGTTAPPVAGVHLELSSSEVHPGAELSMRVVGPPSSQLLYGIDCLMERQLPDGVWLPTYHLAYPLGEPGSRPSWGFFGDRFSVLFVGFSGTRWQTLHLPPVAVPGSYRIAKKVNDTTYYVALSVT